MKWWLNSTIASAIDAADIHQPEKPLGIHTPGEPMAARFIPLLVMLAWLLTGAGCANDHQVVDEHRKALSQEEEG